MQRYDWSGRLQIERAGCLLNGQVGPPGPCDGAPGWRDSPPGTRSVARRVQERPELGDFDVRKQASKSGLKGQQRFQRGQAVAVVEDEDAAGAGVGLDGSDADDGGERFLDLPCEPLVGSQTTRLEADAPRRLVDDTKVPGLHGGPIGRLARLHFCGGSGAGCGGLGSLFGPDFGDHVAQLLASLCHQLLHGVRHV